MNKPNRHHKHRGESAAFFTISLLMCSALFLLITLLPIALREVSPKTPITASAGEAFLSPLNILLIGSGEKESLFMLISVNAEQETVYITQLPADLMLTDTDSKKTLHEHLKYGGAKQSALCMRQLGVKADGFICVESVRLDTLADAIGGIEYESDGELKKYGGKQFMEILRGSTDKGDVCISALTLYIDARLNRYSTTGTHKSTARLFNICETDFSYADYIDAIETLDGIDNFEIVTLKTDSHEDDSGCILTENGKATLREYFSY